MPLSMRLKIKRRYQLEDALEEIGSIVQYGHSEFKFLPFWFEFDGQQIYAHHLDDLPEGFRKYLEEIREGIFKKDTNNGTG